MRRLPKFPSTCSITSGNLMSPSWDTFHPGGPRILSVECECVVRWEQMIEGIGVVGTNPNNFQQYVGLAVAIYLPVGTDVRDIGNTLTWADAIGVNSGPRTYNFFCYQAFGVNIGFPEEFVCAICMPAHGNVLA